MQESERRRTLAEFLRMRRERLSPDEVGLPHGLRRRTPGLRREEVAQLANMGTSWYVWLEQGRDVHPSPQVLEQLAQALRLTPNERRHLFLLAGQELPPHRLPGEETISPAIHHFLDDLDPAPAYVMGRRFDFLAWNKTADCVFGIADSPSPYGHNFIWQLFMQQSIRGLVPDWEQKVRGTLAEFRAASARYPNDGEFAELIRELQQASPEFRRWWPQHEVSRSLDGSKTIEHPRTGQLIFEHVTLQVPSDPDIKITVYTPLGETRAKLRLLLGI